MFYPNNRHGHSLPYLVLVASAGSFITTTGFSAPTAQGQILSKEGSVDYAAAKTPWVAAMAGQALNVADRVRTARQSRALLQLAELGRMRVNELTTLEVLPPRDPASKATVDLHAGAVYFFTRDKPREFQIQTPYALAASRGTEFSVTVEADGTAHYDVFDGQIGVTNNLGGVLVMPGEEGLVKPGQAPVRTSVIEARNLVQWWLYYPGVLDLGDLALTPAEQSALAASLAAYRAGDLPGARRLYPDGRVPQSEAEQTYHAALLLSVGQVAQALVELNTVGDSPASRALQEVIAATTERPFAESHSAATASEWLAKTYIQQAHYDLTGALASARQAAALSPEFGYAWERVAELEFSFGRLRATHAALDSALKFSPRNAQAWVLQGFVAAAAQQFGVARADFQKAIDLDPALGNAWLGRGLVRLHGGDEAGGRADLQTAAALEPNRSELRSYLGKGFDELNDTANAERELRLARQLDQTDPTPWLYSALVLRQQLRFNEAVDDLEKSISLNDNRRVYRSQMLLDQDQAVRSASLATIYQDDGMDEVSTREAARSVDDDYLNYSSHLFLSDSFNALRDPTDFNLRYDTPWLNELLLANMLAPPGAGSLSRDVSQHEYSKLFETDRFGLSTDSEYNSEGQFTELVSQYANQGNTSYSLDLDYRHYDGIRTNNALDRIEWFSQIKQQLTPKDSALLFVEYRDYSSGDNFEYYNPTNARPNYQYTEQQTPNILGGFRHEWTPDIQTMVLGGLLQDGSQFSDRNTAQSVITTNNNSTVSSAGSVPFDVQERTSFQIWTLEANQIVQTDNQRLIAGGKAQSGDFHTIDQLNLSASDPAFYQTFFNNPPATDDNSDHFLHYSAYAYYTRDFFSDLSLTAGIAYDRMTYPTDFRSPPTFGGVTTRDLTSPKLALVWSPAKAITFRGIYARGLSGVSEDQSYRLEPTELAGFVQSFGSTIPESVVGALSAADCEIYGAAMDVKLSTRTYFGVQIQELKTSDNQETGAFEFGTIPPYLPGSTPESLNYSEKSVVATLNQLVADTWSLGLSYHYTDSSLHSDFTAVAPVSATANTTQSSALHELSEYVIFNHPSGFFARAENNWFYQENAGYTPAEPISGFTQQNIYIGWRLKRQRGEISFGVLNLASQDYHLNPLTLYNELPPYRTFVGEVKFNF